MPPFSSWDLPVCRAAAGLLTGKYSLCCGRCGPLGSLAHRTEETPNASIKQCVEREM